MVVLEKWLQEVSEQYEIVRHSLNIPSGEKRIQMAVLGQLKKDIYSYQQKYKASSRRIKK